MGIRFVLEPTHTFSVVATAQVTKITVFLL